MAGIVKSEENSDEDVEDEVDKLHKTVHQLEEEAARKDQQISTLMSRMREYEMGEYGLAEAVNELKECHRIIRARDREIEKLAEEINKMKLKLSDLMEESHKHSTSEKLEKVFGGKHLTPENEPTYDESQRKICGSSKNIQCSLPMQSAMYVEEICSSQVQNELLRFQLRQVCEEALETSLYLQKMYKQGTYKQESFKSLKETISKLKYGSLKTAEFQTTEGFDKHSYENIYEFLKKYISSEDVEGEEIFHELMNQIKLLKSRHMTLIRRYIIMSDREENTRKENLKLRKALNFYWRKNYSENSIVASQFNKEMTSKYLNSDEASFLKELHSIPQNKCFDSQCQESIKKLSALIEKLQEEICMVKQLLEIAHHQTQAAESVCFTQEVELKALKSQFSLFQAQSDEKMLLGKLAMKVLQLQFSQAASVYELKKCKSDKQILQDWYSLLKKEYEENGRKFAGMYLDAQDKVKHLREVLKDLCQRCNAALLSYLPQS